MTENSIEQSRSLSLSSREREGKCSPRYTKRHPATEPEDSPSRLYGALSPHNVIHSYLKDDDDGYYTYKGGAGSSNPRPTI